MFRDITNIFSVMIWMIIRNFLTIIITVLVASIIIILINRVVNLPALHRNTPEVSEYEKKQFMSKLMRQHQKNEMVFEVLEKMQDFWDNDCYSWVKPLYSLNLLLAPSIVMVPFAFFMPILVSFLLIKKNVNYKVITAAFVALSCVIEVALFVCFIVEQL